MENIKMILRNADCVCFDVDSTVCIDEGIDELAMYLGVGKQIAELTNQAMDGNMTFQESLEKRLSLMKPSKNDIESFLKQHPPCLTPGIKDFIKCLQNKNVSIYLISGGFDIIIEPVAKLLEIPITNIFANKFIFNDNGTYSNFDKNQPTSSAGGKCIVIGDLKKKYKTIVHIGDGVTDMEASPPADAFIGFGGNIKREIVFKNSKFFVSSFDEIIKLL